MCGPLLDFLIPSSEIHPIFRKKILSVSEKKIWFFSSNLDVSDVWGGISDLGVQIWDAVCSVVIYKIRRRRHSNSLNTGWILKVSAKKTFDFRILESRYRACSSLAANFVPVKLFFAVSSSSFAQPLAAREFVHFAVLSSSPFLFWSHAHSDIRPQETVTVAFASAKMPL